VIDASIEKGGISDVELMARMGFTPPSWLSWKRKFIEKCELEVIKRTEKGVKFEIKIRYLKKLKLWHADINQVYP